MIMAEALPSIRGGPERAGPVAARRTCHLARPVPDPGLDLVARAGAGSRIPPCLWGRVYEPGLRIGGACPGEGESGLAAEGAPDHGRLGARVKMLVAGASGFVGQRLCVALDRAGHDVAAMTRNPARYRGAGTPVRGDVQDAATLEPALAGCRAAYYLVHSLQDADFERKDATGATAFGEAAARAGLDRIIYLGGLGDDADSLSAHLRSRREVENLLGAAGVPVTVIRAGIIIGHGGISWELTRQLVEHLPVMVTPGGSLPARSRSRWTMWCGTWPACWSRRRPQARSMRSGDPMCSSTPRCCAASLPSRTARCSCCPSRCSPPGCPRCG